MALGVVSDLRSTRSLDGPGEAVGHQEHLVSELTLARLAHGAADGTIRGEITTMEQFLELFFRFLEARYRGEIHELTDRVVASPFDARNRPRHPGDFHVRVPPSPEALAAFFAAWRGDLPAALLARMLGIHIAVAIAWQRASAGDWTAYAVDLSRRRTDDSQRR